MTTKTKKPEPGSLEDLEQKAVRARAWKGQCLPNAPMDLKGFAYAFAGARAAENPRLYDQPESLARLRAEGEALWWRTVAHVESYEAHRRAAELSAEHLRRWEGQVFPKSRRARAA